MYEVVQKLRGGEEAIKIQQFKSLQQAVYFLSSQKYHHQQQK